MAESSTSANEIIIKPPADEDVEKIDHYNVSVQAIRQPTKNLISALLNPPKIFLSDSGKARDWHGLAELIGIGGERIPALNCGADATNNILKLWYQYDKEGATIKKLFLYLEEIDRYDIIDDATPLIDEDIKIYQQSSNKISTTVANIDFETDNYILTRDDVERVEEGLTPQQYDAFVLFADDDIAFATELIDKLENQYGLKLCVKDRDLVVGVFEHESVIRLISERCNRLIAIISSAFLESSSNKFFCSFAQSLGIDQGRRKIIPCLYTQCKVPPELRCYFMLDFKRSGFGGSFWERLRDSVKASTVVAAQKQNIYRSTSQNIPAITQTNNIKSSLHTENNSLKPKKEGVKFSSMVNLNSPETDNTMLDQNLNPSCSATSLPPPITTIITENKKSKVKVGWLKKILQHKNGKCSENVINEAPERHKKNFFARNFKRKMAVAN